MADDCTTNKPDRPHPGRTAEWIPTDTVPGGNGPARLFGGYRVVRQLGEGGMGCLLEAEDVKLDRRVAIKIMRPEIAAHPTARDRFLREARAAAAVRHDHVVPIYLVGEHEGVPFLVMPLLRGESLAERLTRDGPLPPSEAARVGHEAVLGLAAAHAAGLVHRDVKPANLFLEGPQDRVLVLDFGIARSADGPEELTRPGALLGTPGYLAPEQANGLPVDARADLFSLGATLYHAATGTRPFSGGSLTAILRAVAEHHPPPPQTVNPAVPPRLSDLIMRLLAKDPADRPDSAVAVADELVALRSEAPSAAPTAATRPLTGPPVHGRATPRPSRRRVRIVPAIAIGICLLAGVLSILTLGSSPEPDPKTGPQPQHPAGPQAYHGSIDLLVYRKDEKNSDVLIPMSDPRAMPLRPDDQVKLEAEVKPPAFLYVFWIDEAGSVVPAYPWRFNEWGTRPPNEVPTDKLDLKWPGGEALKISGDSRGTETVLLMARPTRLEATDAEVRAWFAGLKPVPFQGPEARVWFENFDVLRSDRLRAPGIANPDDTGGPRGLQAELRQRLGNAAPFSRAFSFSRLGKEGGD